MRCEEEEDRLNWTREWGGVAEWYRSVGILIYRGKGELVDIRRWGDCLVWGMWRRLGWGPIVVGSYYYLAVQGERVDWLEGLLVDRSLMETEVDILGGDFNMVQDTTPDWSDRGAGVVGHSGGLGRWEEIERLSALSDVGRAKWGVDKVFTHWVDRLGSKIDWVLSADCWGEDVWQELGVVWCPWSDHWGVLGQGNFGGSGEGPGHWWLNCALLADGDL